MYIVTWPRGWIHSALTPHQASPSGCRIAMLVKRKIYVLWFWDLER